MVGIAYAAVPLYDWFCRATGFDGTTQVATARPGIVLDRTITVRFDANVGAGPAVAIRRRSGPRSRSRLGEVVTVNYKVINESARDDHRHRRLTTSRRSTSARYFQKINCFCFTEQRLKAGERREMPVVFYVDPALAKDADADELNTITLSYTFYPQREPRPVADTQQTPGKT